MPTTCLNCATEVSDKYCPHCGQKSTVERLSFHSLLEEIFHFFTHVEHVFFRTTRMLITRPGQLFKYYLDGQRKSYHKPISYLLIWIAVFLVIYHFVNRFTEHENLNTTTWFANDAAINAMITKYRSLVEILILPITSFSAWLIIARPKLRYIEILSISFYGLAFLFILLSVEFILAFIFSINFKTNAFDNITAVLFFCWCVFSSLDFYKRYTIRFMVPRVIFAMIAAAPVYMILTRLLAELFIAWNF